jgi:peptide/nickel transport system permease protein
MPETRVSRRRGRLRRIPPRIFLGAALVALMGGLALLAEVVAPGDPWRPVGPPLHPPSARYWGGTDDLGRDLWVQVIHGSRVSLPLGLATAALAAGLGSVVGGLAGYCGGWIDDFLMRLTEVVQLVPRFLLALLVASLFGAHRTTLILLLGFTLWPSPARLLRAQLLTLRERDFVTAARALGSPGWRIVVRHLVPQALPPVIAGATLQVGSVILIEAGLSFLGLRIGDVPSWGYLLNNAQAFLRLAWWMAAGPGLALTLTVLGIHLLAEGFGGMRIRPEAWRAQ